MITDFYWWLLDINGGAKMATVFTDFSSNYYWPLLAGASVAMCMTGMLATISTTFPILRSFGHGSKDTSGHPELKADKEKMGTTNIDTTIAEESKTTPTSELYTQVLAAETNLFNELQKVTRKVLVWLSTFRVVRLDSPQMKDACLDILKFVLKYAPHVMSLETLDLMVVAMVADKDCCCRLVESLKSAPFTEAITSFYDDSVESLFVERNQDLLPSFLYLLIRFYTTQVPRTNPLSSEECQELGRLLENFFRCEHDFLRNQSETNNESEEVPQ